MEPPHRPPQPPIVGSIPPDPPQVPFKSAVIISIAIVNLDIHRRKREVVDGVEGGEDGSDEEEHDEEEHDEEDEELEEEVGDGVG